MILNPAAGAEQKLALTDRLCAAFAAAGTPATIIAAAGEPDLLAAARRAVTSGVCAVAAAGGDGTVSAVASELAGTGVPLGVLPVGTLNHFAKDLGIPLELDAAVRTIVSGKTRMIDAAEVNGRAFINNSSLGLYPQIVRQRELRQDLGHGKWPAFAWAALAALRWFPFLDLRLDVDGKVLRRRTPFVFIGNNAYRMEGLHIGSRASLSEGCLSVYIPRRTGRLGLVRLALAALAGRLHRSANFDAFAATEVRIESRRPLVDVAADGEVTAMRTPLEYRTLPGALRVLVP